MLYLGIIFYIVLYAEIVYTYYKIVKKWLIMYFYVSINIPVFVLGRNMFKLKLRLASFNSLLQVSWWTHVCGVNFNVKYTFALILYLKVKETPSQ